jgi:hypothetical protein
MAWVHPSVSSQLVSVHGPVRLKQVGLLVAAAPTTPKAELSRVRRVSRERVSLRRFFFIEFSPIEERVF